MPPRERMFAAHGTDDDDDAPVVGGEYFKIMGFFSKKWCLAGAIIFAIIGGAMPLVMNVLMGDLVNVMTAESGIMDALTKVIYKMIGFVIGMTVVMGLNLGFRVVGNASFMVDLRMAVYKSLLEQDMTYFDSTSTGVLVGRLSQDCAVLFQIYIDKAFMSMQNLTQSVGGIILAFITMWQVALPVLGIIIICMVVYYFGDKVVDKLWLEYNENSSAASSKAEEVITSFRTIKSFDNEMYEADIYVSQLCSVNDVFKKTSIAQGIKDSTIWLLIHLMIAGFIYFASYLIIDKTELHYQVGDLMILLMSLIFSALGISMALSLSDDFKKARVSAAKILKIINMKPNVDRHVGNELPSIKGKIEFRDVAFKYATRDEYAVQHLSFIVNPGETVALVGESGCGKSTTLQLLQRFYEIEEGEILIDDVSIKTLSPLFLRSQISIVPQSPVLFSMSIADNIRYVKPKAKNEEVAEAARVGNAHNFIMEMPENYKSRVQQTSLSGGQKQRICISRAILTNAPILLLDEATAALDTESEQYVQQSLEVFRQGKTAILVAHRLATVINADRIIVMKDGHVEEEGTHKELLEKNGLYADLVKFQLQ